MYSRLIYSNISQWLGDREVIILKGARQTGKTTLLKQLFDEKEHTLILNCENPSVSNILESNDPGAIQMLFGGNKIVALDEAQSIQSIGRILKLIHDELPQYKVIVTGSSSFELMNQGGEPLTGRNIKFTLYPLSIEEIRDAKGWLHVLDSLNTYLIFGTYPGLVDLEAEKRRWKLEELAGDYLYKDLLVYDQIKSSSLVRQLLKALALQTGSEVTVNELSNLLGAPRQTIETYIDVLEKSFVIFSLNSYSKNLRNEIKKGHKYYFYDNGILNAITGNLNVLQNRNDQGILWENFCVSERLKYNRYHRRPVEMYFWRTYDQAEIDLVEKYPDRLVPFEFKWQSRRKPQLPASFAESYHVQEMKVVTPQNLHLLITE